MKHSNRSPHNTPSSTDPPKLSKTKAAGLNSANGRVPQAIVRMPLPAGIADHEMSAPGRWQPVAQQCNRPFVASRL